VGGYIVLWAAVAFYPFQPTDLDTFFWPSVRVALAGHPLDVYMALGSHDYPNANPPLALLPLTLVGLVLRPLGWMEVFELRRAMVFAAFAPFLLLMAREAVLTIEALRGGALGRRARAGAFLAFLVAPLVWQAVAGYGHIEQPIEIWLALVAARWALGDRPACAGFALGLALLARSSAAMLAVPLALSASQAAGRTNPRRLLGAVTIAAVAVLVAAVGILPFYLADTADVVHSLASYRSALPVGAGSIWTLSHGTAWEALGQGSDILFVGGLAVAINVLLAIRPGGLRGVRLYAAMALTAACFCLLAKSVWPYYFLEVYVFATIWAFARPAATRAGRVLPSLAILALGIMAEAAVTPHLPDDAVRVEGAAMFVLLGGTMAWIVARAARSSEVVAGGPDGR
jgi:hypothetical protein